MKILSLILTTALVSFSSHAQAVKCDVSAELKSAARKFMENNGLILEGEEIEIPDPKISIKWQLKGTRVHNGKCLLVMRLTDSEGDSENTGQLEVLGLTSKGIVKFETALNLNAKTDEVIAEIIDPQNMETRASYFALLKGEEAIDARKVVYSKVRNVGNIFTGYVIKDTPEKFDPTPKRVWRLVRGISEINLRQSNCEETSAIYASQLDEDFDTYTSGAIKKETDEGIASVVCPWTSKLRGLREIR